MSATVTINCRLTDLQRANLNEFATRGERSAPVSFVGRSEILKHVKTRIQALKDAKVSEPESHVIQGPPGAGKTSVLREIIDICEQIEAIPVFMEGDVLFESVQVMDKIYLAIGGNVSLASQSRTLTEQSSKIDISTKMVNFGTGVKYRYEETAGIKLESMKKQVLEGSSIWSVLGENLKFSDNHVIVILIDESQRIEVPPGRDVNPIVTSMHSGETGSLKIMPIFAGLSDTPTRLRRAGLSRRANKQFHLLGLESGEPAKVVRNFIDSPLYGLSNCIDGHDAHAISTLIEEASEKWPRHLHHYMQGLAKEMLIQCDGKQTTEISIADILAYGDNARVDYYEELMGDERLKDCLEAIAGVFNDNPSLKAVPRSVILDRGELQDYSRKQVTDLIETAIHNGILIEDVDERSRYILPIPSSATYLRNEQSRTKTLEAMKSQHENTLDKLGWI